MFPFSERSKSLSLDQEVHALRARWSNGVVPEAAPIHLKGGSDGILLLHGFTSSPWEFRDLATALHAKGFSVEAPLLPGHGASPKSLEKIQYQEWLEAAEQSFDSLAETCKRVSVLGFSMGGPLALHLALVRSVKKLALVAPWIRIYRRPWGLLSPEFKVKTLGRIVRYVRKEKVGNIRDPKGLKNHFAFFHIPLSAVREAVKMVRHVRKRVGEICVPTLLVHSTLDKTIDYQSSKWLLDHLGSTDKKIMVLEKSGHIVFFDYEKDVVVKGLVGFFGG